MRVVFCPILSFVAVLWLLAVLRVLLVQPTPQTDEAGINEGDRGFIGTEQSLDVLKRVHLPRLESWQDRNSALPEMARYHLQVDRRKRISPIQLALSPNILDAETSTLSTGFSVSFETEFDIMPLTALKVPKFWKPPAGKDLIGLESKIGDDETIFLMIARQDMSTFSPLLIRPLH